MPGRLPPWFKQRLPDAAMMAGMDNLLNGLHLHTVCRSALCPNIGECFRHGTATFLILGDTCTRNCGFCAVAKGRAQPLDASEPEHVATAAAELGLKHIVITSVTRDDLPDGGAAHFAHTITLLKQRPNAPTVEVLVPDFRGSRAALQTVAEARPDVINHNIETVPRLYPTVRPQADFRRSLDLLRAVKEMDDGIATKSGIMVGLGETETELLEAAAALREAGCDLLTIGQYLQPSPLHLPVARYIPPSEFEGLAQACRLLGFRAVAAAPLVRSSFHAARMYHAAATGAHA